MLADRRVDGFGRGRAGRPREVLSVGAVGTFAVDWLLPNLREFQLAHPLIDLRIFTNNNRVDLAGAGGYWLTRLKSRRASAAMRAFRDWLIERCTRG